MHMRSWRADDDNVMHNLLCLHAQGGKLDDITVVVACVVEEDVPVVEDAAPAEELADADRQGTAAFRREGEEKPVT